jgi:sortase (surface protein transpeptidase)
MSSARSLRLLVAGRALLVFASVVAAGTVWWWSSSGPTHGAAVVDVEPAIAAVPPSTIAPIPATTTPDPSLPMQITLTTTTTVAPDAGPELSPLADLLGDRGSAIPPAIAPRVRPAALVIDDIEVSFPVRDVGLEDNGELEVPDETEIGWYRYGASPGRPGATVLAAHVTWNRTLGPFHRLGELEPGQSVEVALDDGTSRIYDVVERTMYDKDELPREEIWRTTGPETLVLITCGGDFNPDIRRYRQNIVVYAVPVDQLPDGEGMR